MTRAIAADGHALVVTDQNVDGYVATLRPADGSPPVRLGEGDGFGLSPDGKWSFAVTHSSPARRALPHGDGPLDRDAEPRAAHAQLPRWLPDGRIVMFAHTAGRGLNRGYVFDRRTMAPPRAFTDEGVEPVRYWVFPASPDSARVVARDSQGRLVAYRVDGAGAPEPITGLSAQDLPIEWTADGRALFVARYGELPWRVRRHEIASGRETPWTEIAPTQLAGARLEPGVPHPGRPLPGPFLLADARRPLRGEPDPLGTRPPPGKSRVLTRGASMAAPQCAGSGAGRSRSTDGLERLPAHPIRR